MELRALASTTLVLIIILLTTSTLFEALSIQIPSARIIVGIKHGYDLYAAKQQLRALGNVVSVIPELRIIILSVPASLVNHINVLPFTRYVEEDAQVTVLSKQTTSSSSKVFFIDYTQSVTVAIGAQATLSYTIKNNNIRTQVTVFVQLVNEAGNIMGVNQHNIPARSTATGSLTFIAPNTPGSYKWILVMVDVSNPTLVYDNKVVYLNTTAPEQPSNPSTSLLLYTDTVYWNIKYVKAPDVWHNYNETYGNAALGYHPWIQVAVLDTGIDYTHQELRGAVTWCAKYLGGGSIVYEGLDLSQCMDGHSHGTHVAGILAARINNISIAGVAPYVTLYAVKVLNDSGSGYVSDLARGIIEAVKGPDDVPGTDDDADIISMSIGAPNSTILYEAVKYAYNYGVVLVAAAGNKGLSSPTCPACYSEVIAVGAIDLNYNVPSWSNRNPDLVAPGVSIYSTMPNNSYGYKSGTSMACPHISGVVAILQATRLVTGLGKLTPEQVRLILIATAVDLGVSGYDEKYGYGLIDAYSALRLALSS